MRTLSALLAALLPVGAMSAQVAAPLAPITSRAIRTLTLPGSADFLAVADSTAWVTNIGRVERLGTHSLTPITSIPIARPCGAMAVDFGSLWVVNCEERTLIRLKLPSGQLEATIATGIADPSGELSVATGAGSVWLLTDSTGIVSRVDPRTNRVVARIRVKPHSYAAAFGFGSVWVTNTGVDATAGSVQRVDPATNSVSATIPTGPAPRFLAAGEGGVWTLNQGDGTVTRIDPRSNAAIATINVGVPGPGGDIATGADRVWVRATDVLLSAIDPQSNTVVERFGPPSGSGAVRASPTHVWVTAHDVHKVWILRP